MKTLNTVVMAAICFGLTATQQTFSQNSTAFNFKVPQSFLIDTSSFSAIDDHQADASAVTTNKAVIRFHQANPSVANEQWTSTAEGSRVNYVSSGARSIDTYNQRGRWTSTVRYLAPDQVPQDIKRIVDEDFPGYKLFFGQYIRTAYGSVHLVKIQSATKWKTLRVSDTDVETMEEFDKL